jgi:small subunit ribosomal protein S29
MRVAFNKGKDRIINAIATEQMLRYLPGTKARHTIKRPIQVEPYKPRSATDTFYEYTKEVIPRIEESIEKRLLHQYMDTLPSNFEKKEVMDAYKIRKHELSRLDEKAADFVATPDYEEDSIYDFKAKIVRLSPEEIEERKEIIWSEDGQGLSYHTYDTIGKYTVFPRSHWKRMFPRETCGFLDQVDFKHSEVYGLMCTEESLKLTYDLARRTLPKERNVNYEELIKNGTDLKEVLKDEQMFVQMYQDFCIDLLDVINERNSVEVRQVYESPSIFDGVVGILLRELKKKPVRNFLLYKPTRKKIMGAFTDMLVELFETKEIHLRELKDVIELKRILEVTLTKADLEHLAEFSEFSHDTKKYKIYLQGHQKYCYHFWRPEDMREYALQGFKGFNTGCLLWGRSGSGKSGALSYVIAWAHENNWAVVAIPRARKFTHGGIHIERHLNGLYMQPQLAKELLEDLRIANQQKFDDFKVNLDIYGKFDMTGIHDDEPEPCPRTFDPRRRTWSDAWKDHLTDMELKQIAKDTPRMQKRISDFVKEPRTLGEIADFGIENPDQATCAIAEILHQLYNTDESNLLVAIDGYSDWFKPSEYTSFRYANSGYSIPPHDIAIPRLFMKFDGHKIRNGFKICASTQQNYFNHLFTPDMIDSPKCFNVEMQPLHLNEFRNALRYFQMTRRTWDEIPEWRVETMHMEAQGSWRGLYESYFSSFDFQTHT